MSPPERIGIIGSGAWATTLGVLLARNGHTVRCLGRDRELMAEYNAAGRNTTYLPSFALPMGQLAFTADPEEALEEISAAILAVPSEHVAGTCGALAPLLEDPDLPILSAVKGFVDDELCLVTDVLPQQLGPHPVGVISGPNLAREVLRGDPAITVIAAEEEEVIARFRDLLASSSYRIYGSRDLCGVQIAGATKNIFAIAAGICTALGFGMNTQSALLSRGLAEMVALVEHCGGERATAMGIAGLGDAVCTCLSPFSRNVQVGRHLGEGADLTHALIQVNGIPEGVGTTRHVHAYALAHGLELPITAAIAAVLQGRMGPEVAMRGLMQRTWKMEVA